MGGEDGHKTSVPSFSSFPAAPSFDSFPVASTSKARQSSSDSEAEREHKKRKSKHRHEEQERREHRDKYRDRNRTGSDKEHTASRRADKAAEARDRHSKSSTDESRKYRRRRSRSDSVDDVRHKSRKDKKDSTPQFYNVPNLALGEVATLSRLRDEDADPEYAALPDYKLFTLDRKGDQDVRKYGRLYRGSVPRYRRTGFGHVLGLPSEFRITLESAREGDHLDVVAGRDFSKGTSLQNRSVRNRLTDRSFKRLILAPTTKAVQSSIPAAVDLTEDTDFIALPQSKSAKEKVAGLEHEDGQDYRSAAGQIKASDVKEEDQWDELEENDEEDAESFDDYLKRRNVEFERHLKAEPNDTKAWLELVKFQDIVHDGSSDDAHRSRVVSTITRRALAEIKIAILQRALEKSGNETSTDLHLALLKYGSDLWDTKELMQRWMDLLRMKPEEMEVWLQYLTFRQTNATAFTVQEVVDVYADCLKRIAKSILRNPRGSRARSKLEENYLYLFLRVCLLLRQADYAERALAAFQALVELNFYMPDRYRAEVQASPSELAPIEAALDDLELFWDSEVARVGEPGSSGWCNTSDTSLPPTSFGNGGSEIAVKQVVSAETDPYEAWAQNERISAHDRRRPTRTTDVIEDEEDDPYSTILFSDIRSFLFVISSPDARSQLLYSFLFYLGLPLNPPDTPSTSRLASDTFLHADDFSASFSPQRRASFWPAQSAEEFLRALIPFDTIGGQAMEPVRTSAINDPFQPPFRKFPTSPDSLFTSQPRWFCLLDQRAYMQDLDIPFIRNTLAQLRLVSKDIFLTLAYFSIEASLSAKGSVKAAKSILKADSKNLLLWDAYARIERSNGNLKVARNVYMQALSLSQSFNDAEKVDMPLLWRAWTELEWEDGQLSAALAVLVASSTTAINAATLIPISEGKEVLAPSPAGVLRARQYYRRLLDAANAPDSPQSLFRHRISITFCLALLEYLSSGLDASNAIMDNQIRQLRSEDEGSAEEEEARALQAKIAFRHTQAKAAFRPAVLRDILESALKAFPNNSIFLSLHLFNEIRTRIENRVRRVLDEIVLKVDSVTSEGWLFAIYAELHISSRTYNVQSVRSLFERAVDHPHSRSSLSIWSLYIEFELRQKEVKRAKRLLHRALAECPWAKDLYLMAFASPFRQAYRSAELRDIHRLMLEKGIRLHKSLETAVAGWQSEVSEEEVDMDAEETEDSLYAQKQAAERLRLMPV